MPERRKTVANILLKRCAGQVPRSKFYRTELDLQLRRRNITTLIFAGVMTNFGVEQTAREAWQQNYAVIIAEDACASLDAEMHSFSINRILPRVARVRSMTGILEAFGS